jgi:RNA polymerase sigma-70 factor (ECF subfamily)
MRPRIERSVSAVVRAEYREDVVHEVYLRLMDRLTRYRPQSDGTFQGWLTVVARNIAIDFVRRERAAAANLPLLSLEEPAVRGKAETIANAELPTRTDEELEAERVFERALDEGGELNPALLQQIRGALLEDLSAREVQAVLLHYLRKLSYKDIAGVLGISENTVLTLLSRARSKLRARLH